MERFYFENIGFHFDNTSLCCLCVCISLPLMFSIYAAFVILLGLYCFINSVLAYLHILHIHCLIISLN